MHKKLMYGLITGLLMLLLPLHALTQEDNPEYEEISIFLRVEGVGGFDITCLLSLNDNRLFLPVTDLFTLLKINQETSPEYDSIKGFFIDEQKRYLINFPNRFIKLENAINNLQELEIVKTRNGLYLFSGVFGKVFGLYCNFNFRALSVELKTDLELPAIRELRLAQMRKNIEMLKGDVIVDTTLRRKYHLLNFGMVDWSINSTQVSGGPGDTRISTGLGGELLGGETNLVLNYSDKDGLNDRNQQYSWRWANNDIRLIKQVRAGKINTGSIASIYSPVIGVTATNTPTAFRRSFGQYTLSDYTQPGWSVELYINNVLVNYVVADASGFFKFDIPLVYGASDVTLKYYGPYGEQRTSRQSMNIPFNFMPKGEAEYTISSGIVQDSLNSLFTHGEVNYGINRFITVGTGIEYLSSLPDARSIPFLKASATPHANILLSGEYNHKVVSKGKVSYRSKNNMLFEIDYSKYSKEQKAIKYNYLEERKATIAIPVKLPVFNGYTRLGFKQNVYKELTYNSAEILISTFLGPVNANLTTFTNWVSGTKPFFSSNLGVGVRILPGLTARSQTQFDVNNTDIISYRIEVETKITRSGYFSLTYDENIRAVQRSLEFAFRYDLPFAQTNASTRYGNKVLTTTQGARGSLAFGSGNRYVHTDNRSVLGRGGISIFPYLDINHNSIQDNDEPIIYGLNVRINGGRVLSRVEDSIIRIVELEPYISYLVELDNEAFDNIAWQLKNKAMKVYVDPNQFKKIEIPIFPMGEINGVVQLRKDKSLKGLGRILVNIYNEKGNLVTKILTEQDGYYTFLGLPPGKYHAEIDTKQLDKLSFVSLPPSHDFEIFPSVNGDIIDGIDFVVSVGSRNKSEILQKNIDEETITQNTSNIPPNIKTESEVIEAEKPKEVLELVQKQEVDKKTSDSIPSGIVAPIHSVQDTIAKPIDSISPTPNVSDTTGSADVEYFVQVGAFKSFSDAEKYLNRIKTDLTYSFHYEREGGMVKIRFGYFKTIEEAQKCKSLLDSRRLQCFIGSRK